MDLESEGGEAPKMLVLPEDTDSEEDKPVRQYELSFEHVPKVKKMLVQRTDHLDESMPSSEDASLESFQPAEDGPSPDGSPEQEPTELLTLEYVQTGHLTQEFRTSQNLRHNELSEVNRKSR
eukprot:gene21931-8552_t